MKKTHAINDHDWLSVEDVARVTTLGTRTVKRWLTADRKKLPSYRIGTRRLIWRADLDKWVEQFREDVLQAEAKQAAATVLQKLRSNRR